MKKLKLLTLLLFCYTSVFADKFEVYNHIGVHCVSYTLKADETFYSVAKRFNVRPSTLALCNDLRSANQFAVGSKLHIPLTETNFFRVRGISSGTELFQSVYHKIQPQENLEDLKANYLISGQNLLQWNGVQSLNQLMGLNEIVVGFIKFDVLNKQKFTPHFIAKEVSTYGTAQERQAYQVEKKSGQLTESKIAEPSLDLEPESKPVLEEKPLLESKVANKGNDGPELVPLFKKEKKKKVAKTSAKSSLDRFNERFKQLGSGAKKSVLARKEEREQKRMQRYSSKTKEKPSLGTMVKVKKPSPETLEVVVDENEIVQVQKDTLEVAEVQNKLRKLTLLKSSSGNGAFFYSGFAKGKFYAFTNVAPKGAIIKVSNLANGRFVLAEVIDYLPEQDHKRGYIAKISNNAVLPLGAKENKNFKIQLNY